MRILNPENLYKLSLSLPVITKACRQKSVRLTDTGSVSVCEERHVPFPHTRMFPLESPVIASPFSAKVTHSTNLGFSCFCNTRTHILYLDVHRPKSHHKLSWSNFIVLWVWQFVDVLQTGLASWPACLSPGSRNRDVTCHRWPRCCCLSGGSLQQTLTRWSTEPKHTERETSSADEDKEVDTIFALNNYKKAVSNTFIHVYMQYSTHMHSYLDLSQFVLSLPVPHRQHVIVGVVHNTQCVSSVLTNRNRHNASHDKYQLTWVFFQIHMRPSWPWPFTPQI